MNEQIFRKKSLNRIQSPENLNDYIRVSNPGVWLFLIAVVALLAGAIVWGVFGRLETGFESHAVVESGEAVCYLEADEAREVLPGMPVKLGGTEGKVLSVDSAPGEDGLIRVVSDVELADGAYDCKIVTERIRPLSFVTN